MDQFLSFLACQAIPSISQNHPPLEFPTPAVHSDVLPDNYESPKSEGHLFSHPTTFNSGREARDFLGMAPQAVPWVMMTLTLTKNHQQSRSPQICLPSW